MSVLSDSRPRVEQFSGVADAVRDGVAYLSLTDHAGHEIEIEWDAADLQSKSIEEGHHFQLTTAAVDGNTEFDFRPVVARPLDIDMRREIEEVLGRYRERGLLEDQSANGLTLPGSELKPAGERGGVRERSKRRHINWGRVRRPLVVAACAMLLVGFGMGLESWRSAALSDDAVYKKLRALGFSPEESKSFAIRYAQRFIPEGSETLAALMHAAKERLHRSGRRPRPPGTGRVRAVVR